MHGHRPLRVQAETSAGGQSGSKFSFFLSHVSKHTRRSALVHCQSAILKPLDAASLGTKIVSG